uniref:NADH dehydrogenase [ubiquinone] flavoprotein 3, mitochondrial n=1 Tax=Myxine glutinosa TaxID=7769 RepID=UPI00358FC9F9
MAASFRLFITRVVRPTAGANMNLWVRWLPSKAGNSGTKPLAKKKKKATSLPSPPQSPQPDAISESSGLHYMNTQHWKYVSFTFMNFESELSAHRLPQPSSG